MKRSLMPALVAALLFGCIPGNGPLMAPGEDCNECHGGDDDARESEGEDGEDGPFWSAAGTVYPSLDAAADAGLEGARVHLTDANGRTVTLRSNQAGNFYTAERLAFPLRVSVTINGRTDEMEDPVLYGGCNSCHAPAGEAEGRLTLH